MRGALPAVALDIGQAAALMPLLKGRAASGAAVAVGVDDLNLASSVIFAPGLLEEVFAVPFERLRAADGSAVVLAAPN